MAILWGMVGLGIVILGIVRYDGTLIIIGALAMAHASDVARLNGLERRHQQLG